MKITEFIFKDNYRLDDSAFAKCMDLWRKISKFDCLLGSHEPYQIKNKVYNFFQGYCNVYFNTNSDMFFFENVLYKGFKKFKVMVQARFAVINELFSTDS
jgi:hypothetical protein